MDNSVNKSVVSSRFRKTLVFLITPAVAVLTIAFYFPVNAAVTQSSYLRFTNDLRLRAVTADYAISRFGSSVDSLVSRSVIRQYLHDYVRGKRSFVELTEFTRPRYADGAKVEKDLLGARRMLADGTVVAEFEDQQYLSGAEEGELASADSTIVLRDGPRQVVVITRPIQESSDLIGYDQAAFDATLFAGCASSNVPGDSSLHRALFYRHNSSVAYDPLPLHETPHRSA